MVVNRAQAYKWSGDDVTAKKIIDAVDWTATGFVFQLAHAVLSDDFGRAIELMTKIGASGDIDKVMYREWPLFREIRKTPHFARSFEQIFGEPLNSVKLEGPSGRGPEEFIQ